MESAGKSRGLRSWNCLSSSPSSACWWPPPACGAGSPRTARRMQCTNNLKQLGLSLHNFHDVNNIFPAADDELINSPVTGSKAWKASWMTRILPYIEQQSVFQLYRFDRDWQDGPTNSAANGPIRTNIKAFICPSAPTQNTAPGQRGSRQHRLRRHDRTGIPESISERGAGHAVSQSDSNFIGYLGTTSSSA